jgi:dipeptidyl aminopeptidase/acylaminoacyl peptidase
MCRIAIALVLLLAVTGGDTRKTVKAAGRRPLELIDYYRIEAAGRPSISPDGKWIAFTRTRIAEEENRRHSEIWLAPADGSAAAFRITRPSFNSSNPRWSPDGRLLAFTSRRSAVSGEEDTSESSVWFLRMDTPAGEAFQIPGVGGSPLFSPDNQWIAFTKKTPASVVPKEVGSELERTLAKRFKGRIYEWMNFRFDGRGYLPDPRDSNATPAEELYIVPRAGGTPRQVTRMGVNVESPAWRPDSAALAIIANQYQRDEYTYERADLWLADVNGSVRRLTNDGFNYNAPCWAPDGKSLAVRRQQGLSEVISARQNYGGAVDLYRISTEDGKLKNLTAEWDLIPDDALWHPDGRYVYFTAAAGGNTHLFRVPSAAGAVEQVTRGDRRLGDLSGSATLDRIAYTSADPAHPAEVYSSRLDGSDEKRISSINADFTQEVNLSKPERITFSSKDGTPVEGWVLLPATYAGNQSAYPLIVCIHGGPHGAYANDFSFPFQLLAANGYVVLYTNPRGSTGYGEKFLWATWGGWGVLDYQDVMAGVDFVTDHYRIDTRRMGVTGYSYGGFLTNWIITQTDRFAAAVTGAGISNWISDYGTADIPRTKESEFYGPPWESSSGELLCRLSPITHAAKVRTPTLFVHGEADLRVPIEQAEQMYTALKKLRIPARFVRYPEMYHGGWTPWNTVHRYNQELKWWGKYLGNQ